MKKLTINIYRDYLGDCTNGGVSANADTLEMVVYDEGETPNEADGDLMLVKRTLWDKNADYLAPIRETDRGCVGWMNGGNFGYRNDSRFERYTGHDNPLPIFDRQETQELYDALSR